MCKDKITDKENDVIYYRGLPSLEFVTHGPRESQN